MPDGFFANIWSGWVFTWPTSLLAIIWLLWVTSWVVASFWQARSEKVVRPWESRGYLVPLIAGGILLSPWAGQLVGEKPLYQIGAGGAYIAAALIVAGVSFTWWGRIYLGSFWSNAITRKEGHHVIDTGPYGVVRHPIYTGLIAAILVTGFAVGTISAIIGAFLIGLGQWQKARMEEVFLTEELGADQYGTYCRRVPMIIPFLPPR